MTNGTVLASDGWMGWYRLTPNASGSYVDGTWSPIASMNDSRLYMGSVVLPDGRLFVAGGEYGTGRNTAEIYNPLTNSWTHTAPPLTGDIADSTAQLLPGDKVLVANRLDAGAEVYDVASNTWSFTTGKLGGDINDEETLTRLPDGSLLTVDVWNAPNAQKYVPTEDRWVSAGTVPSYMVGPGAEFGPGLLLPDGRAFFVGGNGTTAYYTSGPTPDDPGSWQAGPSLPNGLLADDAPGAVMPNGHVLLEGEAGHFSGPSYFFDFDPSPNTYTALPAPYGGATGGVTFVDRMLVLPTGQVLFDNNYVYTPDSGPNAAWQPTVASVSSNVDGSYHLTGTLLNGVSAGASYGDDATMDSNYPLVQLMDASGNVTYATTFNWAPGQVGDHGTMSTDFSLPASLPTGTYSLRVVADGIASNPVSFSVGAVDDLTVVTPQTLTVNENASGSGNVLTGAVDSENDAITAVAGTFATANGSVTIAADGSYTYTANAGYFGSDSFTFTAHTADDSTSGTVNVTVNGVVTGSASFVAADTATQGNWYGTYGADGYDVSQDANVTIPSYAQVSFSNQSDYAWALSTSDVRALEKPENLGDRIAGTWYTGGVSSFTIDINLTDGNTHQVALYALDWDSTGRAETIKVLDAGTGTVLDTQTLAAGSFYNGEYLAWNIQGHVKFEIDYNGGYNAVISGLFFGTGNAVNDLTVVTPQALTVNENSNGSGNVLTGAVDSENNAITAVAGSFATANGSVTIAADGSYTYTPNAGYFGSDSFTFTAYTADDSTSGIVNVTVSAVNDLTVVTPQALTVNENSNGSGNVLTGAIDREGAAITAVVGTFATANGSVTIAADGSYTYTPNAGYFGSDSFAFAAQTADDSTSGTVNVTVNSQLQSATALTSSANPSVYGQTITLTATVTALTGSGTPTGSVIFMDGNNPLGSAALNSSGVATLSVSLTTVGNNALIAVYSGDTNFVGSTSTALSQTVNKAQTQVALGSSANPSGHGQAVTFTAIVSAAGLGSGTATGTVTFYNGSVKMGTSTVNSSGVAAFTPTAPLTVGSHAIKAVYSGDGNFTTSSKTLTETVKKAATNVAASSSTAILNQPVILTATVTTVGLGSGTPTGTVTFKDTTTNTVLGTATLSNGSVTLSGVVFTTKGRHKISVTYSGDGNDLASSTTLLVTV